MKVFYRILSTNEKENTFLVRYYTDVPGLTENDLAITNGDAEQTFDKTPEGYPVRCRTDFNLPLWSIKNPTEQQIEEQIIQLAPMQFFNQMLLSLNNEINHENIQHLIGETKNFEIKTAKESDSTLDQFI